MRTFPISTRWLFGAALALGLLLLVACGQTLVPGADQGTVTGQVLAGPTCPVQSATNPCPDKPVPNRAVMVMTSAGAVAASTTTDAQGRYSVAVAAGSYIMRVAIIRGQIGMRQTSPSNVEVVAGQTITVNIELDTGIR